MFGCSPKIPCPKGGGRLSKAQKAFLIIASLCLLTVLLLVNNCCYRDPVPVKTNPINAPEMRFIYNTRELAEYHDLPLDLCGTTNSAFIEYV